MKTIFANGQLEVLKAWTNSSKCFYLKIPASATEVSVLIGKVGEDENHEPVSASFHPTRQKWYVYIPQSVFPKWGDTRWKVVAKDGNGGRFVAGEGIVRIYAGSVWDKDERGEKPTPPFNRNTHVMVGGNWYCVKVEEDADRNLCFSVDQTPDTSFAGTSEPYALNVRTGKYHKLHGSLVGNVVSVAIESDGDDTGVTCYAQGKDGMYYRIEAEDSAAGITMAVGTEAVA